MRSENNPENQKTQGARDLGQIIANKHANHIATKSGKVMAVCCCCNRKSKAAKAGHKGEPDLWNMARGWSEAPYPADFKHSDGSTGSMYTCPTCNKRLHNGEELKMRGEQKEKGERP